MRWNLLWLSGIEVSIENSKTCYIYIIVLDPNEGNRTQPSRKRQMNPWIWIESSKFLCLFQISAIPVFPNFIKTLMNRLSTIWNWKSRQRYEKRRQTIFTFLFLYYTLFFISESLLHNSLIFWVILYEWHISYII